MDKLRLIRGSEVSSFLSDRQAWKYRWVDHLVKRQQDGKLFFGTLFHKYLENYYNAASDLEARRLTDAWIQDQDLSAMDQVFYQELMELFKGVSAHYEQVYSGEVEGMRVVATELRFAVPLYDDVADSPLSFAYEGTIDLVYVDGDGNLCFMDHKTVSSIDRYVSNAVLDRQISRYWWALTALQEGHGYIWEDESWKPVQDSRVGTSLNSMKPVSKFVYNLIRKEAPKPPRELKGGVLSKAKDQNTTHALYMQALIERGLDPADYEEILEILAGQNKFMKRVEVFRNWSECEAAINDFAKAAQDMLRVREQVAKGDESSIYWNITWDTPTFNAYYPLIQAEVMGENVGLVRAALYETEDWNEVDNYIDLVGE